MPLYSKFGDALVRDQELKDRYSADEYHSFIDPSSNLNELDFSTGRIKNDKWEKVRTYQVSKKIT